VGSAGSDRRAAVRDHLACHRAGALQRLPVGQEHRACAGAVLQSGHVEKGRELDVDDVRLGDVVVGRRSDQCQRAGRNNDWAGERVGERGGRSQGQRTDPLFS